MDEYQGNQIADAFSFSGERYFPEIQGNIKLEHLHRYLFACNLAAGKCVLDIASGEGYGSAMLAKTAHKVVGVDLCPEAVSHAQVHYKSGNLEFRLGSCLSIPLDDSSVDLVVSFETIEHINEHEAMILEFKRVLRSGGLLIMSSPDKLEYSTKPNFVNKYHCKELYRDEFINLINLNFKKCCVFGQRVIYGSAIFCEEMSTSIECYNVCDETLSAIPRLPNSIYLVVVASDYELPLLRSGVMEQPDIEKVWQNAIEVRDKYIEELDRNCKAMMGTLSWKITAPMRWFGKKLGIK